MDIFFNCTELVRTFHSQPEYKGYVADVQPSPYKPLKVPRVKR